MAAHIVELVEEKRMGDLQVSFLSHVDGLGVEERVVDVVFLHFVVEVLDLEEKGEKRGLGQKEVVCAIFEEQVLQGEVEVVEQNAVVAQNAKSSSIPLDEEQLFILQKQVFFLETIHELPVDFGGESFGQKRALVGEDNVQRAEVFVGNGLNQLDVLNVFFD